MKYKELFKEGMEALTKAGISEARLDALLLLEYICHTARQDLILYGDRQVEEADCARYRAMLEKRQARIPLQHLTGEQDFMGFTFQVNAHVLVPRQDTELLVEEAMKHIGPGGRILDMCTGSGCILLSLLALTEKTGGVGADISAEALAVAQENRIRIERQCGKELKAEFVQSDLFSEVQGRFDLLVSNPPYIATKVIDTLEPEVRLHEPMLALDGREDGLYFYKKILAECGGFLTEEAVVLFEIGYDQGEAVSMLMKQAGFISVTVKKDYAGLDRIVLGYRRKSGRRR